MTVWITFLSIGDHVTKVMKVERKSELYKWAKLLEHTASLCWYVSISSAQGEMFMSVFNDVYYDQYLTTWGAVLTIFLTTLFMFALGKTSKYRVKYSIYANEKGKIHFNFILYLLLYVIQIIAYYVSF